MEGDWNFRFVFGYDSRYTAQPVVHTDNIVVASFLFQHAVNEFRSTQNVVDEYVVEHAKVRAPLLQVVNNEHWKNVTRIRNQRPVNLYTLHDFAGFEVSRVKSENGYVIAHGNKFTRNIVRVRT
jgi:hypothetical protein